MKITMDEYNVNKLNLVAVQYSLAGKNQWQTGGVIQAGDLEPLATIYDWDVSKLPDGAYDLRLKIECGDDNNLSTVYSNISSGVIDRKAPEVFGVPEPADRIFNNGDEIWEMPADRSLPKLYPFTCLKSRCKYIQIRSQMLLPLNLTWLMRKKFMCLFIVSPVNY